MDLKPLVDSLAANAQPIATALFILVSLTLLLRTRVARRVWSAIEETFFTNWQLGLLAATGIVLSAAAGWTTYEGMRNFTGESYLSAMRTFGVHGVLLIVSWLIGESFANGMSTRAQRSQSSLVNPVAQTWIGLGIGLLLFIVATTLVLQWTGQTDIRAANPQELSWSKTGDKFLMLAAGLLAIALFTLYAASDVVKPYIQGTRIILRNAVLWIMLLGCMATSIFFSFDSLFTSIFPQAERARAAEIRGQNQVSGILADIEQTIASRRAKLAEELFTTDAWNAYEGNLDAMAQAAARSEGAIERYVNEQIESRRRAVTEQQERMTSAQSGQAGLAQKKITLTEEKSRLAAERPSLAADYDTKKADYDAKMKEVDAKRVEALAEDKGVEGSGKEGKGPMYRQRMSELRLLQAAGKIAEERMTNAQNRLTDMQQRLATIDRELAMIDGDLSKLKGEAQTAEQRIKLAEDAAQGDTSLPKIDPARILPTFERAMADFRTEPTPSRLAGLQQLCTDIGGALSSTPETKQLIANVDCDSKPTVDAGSALFTLQTGLKSFEANCVGGDKLVAQTSADALFAFARRCLADSALPSDNTSALRTKINQIELARDDKAHRFVVSMNAFKDGNHLAYLALAIAAAIDSLIFMSGLFGANALRSPLSDVPTFKSRSGAQLEATINAALGPHPYETAWLTLNAMRPMTYSNGFSAMVDLSTLERSTADRIRMVLTAGADIGAVETISMDPERYRVRSELREYLSSVCDKHFKSDTSAKDRARLEQIVSAALAPHPQEHAEIVLHTLEPIRETEGFTSMVTLSKIASSYDSRVVRRVMNAGATQTAVAPDKNIEDRYYISPNLYEVLLTIRATSPASATYIHERNRFEGIDERLPLDAGMLREEQTRIAAEPPPPQLQKPPPQLPRIAPLSDEEKLSLARHYREELLGAIGLTPDKVDRRLRSEASRHAMSDAWRALDNHSKKNQMLGHFLRTYLEEKDQELSRIYTDLRVEAGGDARKTQILGAVDDKIRDELALYMLFPETGLIDYLIDEIESAAQADDGLQEGEQSLKDQLKYVREGLGSLNLASAQAWDEIRQRLGAGYTRDTPNIINKFIPRDDDNQGDDDDI